jgi:hypothetical protein
MSNGNVEMLLICYEFMSGRAGYNADPIVFKKANFCMFTTWRRMREWRCSSVILNFSTSCRPMKSFMLRLFLPLLKGTHYQLHRWLCVLHRRGGSSEVTAVTTVASIIFLWKFWSHSYYYRHVYYIPFMLLSYFSSSTNVLQPSSIPQPLPPTLPCLVLYTPTFTLYRDKFAKHREQFRFDITKHTYTRSWRVMEKLTREEYVFWRFHTLYLLNVLCYPYTAQVRPWPIVKPSHTKASSNYVNYLELLGTIFIKPTRVFPTSLLLLCQSNLKWMLSAGVKITEPTSSSSS